MNDAGEVGMAQVVVVGIPEVACHGHHFAIPFEFDLVGRIVREAMHGKSELSVCFHVGCLHNQA